MGKPARSGASEAVLPASIGRYRVESLLGRGGMGAVYRATDQTTGKIVALKTLVRDDPRFVALFEREYHTLASLVHPRVIEVYDFGIDDTGQRYYTMELLEGHDLFSMAPVPWRLACIYLRDVAASLSQLHARRLVHRDVSPRNVRLDTSGRAKLIDFGALASFGAANEIVGTPMCIAPEVVRSLELDQRTDLFSLGVTAYWALTGTRPFEIAQIRDAMAAYCVPPPPSERRT